MGSILLLFGLIGGAIIGYTHPSPILNNRYVSATLGATLGGFSAISAALMYFMIKDLM